MIDSDPVFQGSSHSDIGKVTFIKLCMFGHEAFFSDGLGQSLLYYSQTKITLSDTHIKDMGIGVFLIIGQLYWEM